MHRTQIYLPEETYQELQMLSQARRQSLAELVRQAVDRYLADTRGAARVAALEQAFGMWSDLPVEKSSQAMVREIRGEWASRDEAAAG